MSNKHEDLRLILKYTLLGESTTEIGNMLGISRQAVSKSKSSIEYQRLATHLAKQLEKMPTQRLIKILSRD